MDLEKGQEPGHQNYSAYKENTHGPWSYMDANKIILYAFKLTQLTSVEGKLKNEVIWANFNAYKRILIGSHL